MSADPSRASVAVPAAYARESDRSRLNKAYFRILLERTLAGLAAARARGRAGGRPRLMTPAKLRAAMTMMANRSNAAPDVAEQLGISLSTLYAYVNGAGEAKPRARKLLGAAGVDPG